MTEMSALGIRVTGEGIAKTTAELDAFTAAAIKAAAAASKPINTAGGGGGAAALTAVTAATKSLSSAQVTATATTRGASGALQEMAAKIAATEAALSRQTAAERAAAAATASHASSLGAVSPALAAYAARASAAAATGQKVTAVAGQQKQGLQQLSFQINDVATQFASGTPPMQIFAQQAGQTVQAVQLMVGGTSKLAAFLSGPWGIAVVAATVVLVPFIGRLWESKTAADSARVSLDSLIAKYKQAQGERAKFETAGADLAKQIAERDRLQTQLNTARTNSGNPNAFAYGSEAKRIKELNVLIGQGRAGIDEERTSTFHLGKSAGDLAYSLSQVKTETVGATGAAQGHTAAIKESTAAYDQAFNATQSYIDQLEQQNAEFGKTEKEIRLMEVARRIDAAATDEQRAAIQRLSDTHEMQIGVDELAKSDAWRKSHIADIQREIALLGTQGEARARASLALEEEGFKADALKNHVIDVNGAWDEYQAKQLELINGQSFLDGEAEKAAILLDRVNALSGAMSGGIFGGITGALTSRDPIASLIGSGGIGSIIGMGTKDGRDAYQAQADAITQSLEKVFGVSGVFVKTLAGALQGSSLGALGGSLTGLNNPGSSIGGALGGALMSGGLGKTITKGLTSALGSALGGALSSAVPILGGIAGGLLGSLFKKDQYGSTTVTGSGVGTTYGNNADSRSGSGSIADAFNSAINKLASSLDVTLGKFEVSIGVTNGKINVNPGTVSGMIGTTKQRDTIDFREDQAAALEYAVRNAIEDGALNGLSEGWKKFLLSSNDINAQFAKLANLKGAYDELQSIKDPQGYALAALDKTFNALRDTASKAGDDLARVEELYQLKRKDIIESNANDMLDKELAAAAIRVDRLNAEGKSEEALALARKLQLDAADDLSKVEYRLLYTAQDAAVAAQKLAAAQAEQAASAERLTDLQIRLARAQGDEGTAKALEQMQELNAAQSDQERALLAQIFAADTLRETSEAAQKAIEEAASKFGTLAKNLRDYANSLTNSDAAGAGGYRNAQVEFMKQSALASSGDTGGLEALQSASSAFLDASRARSSAEQYRRDFGQVLAGLDKAATVAERLTTPTAAILSTSDGGTLREVAVTITDGNAALREEVIQLRKDLNAALLAIAQNTGSTDRTIRRWDAGDSVRISAADPVPVETV